MAYKKLYFILLLRFIKVNQYIRVFSIFSGASRAVRSAARGRSPKAKGIYPSPKIW